MEFFKRFTSKRESPKPETAERETPKLDAETQEMFSYCKDYAKNFLSLQYEGKPEDVAIIEGIKKLIDEAEPATSVIFRDA